MKMKVVVIPWLAQGHITPFLELSQRLATKNIQIYFCSTPINLSSIKKRIEKDSVSSNNITLVEFHLQSTPKLPPHYHTTNGLPPHLLQTLVDSFQTSTPDTFSNLLKTLTPDVVIYDIHMSWAPTVASSLNIPAFFFSTFGAAVLSLIIHLAREPPNKFSFPEIIHPDISGKSQYGKDNDHLQSCYELLEKSSKIILINTFRELEGKFLDYIPSLMVGKKKIVPVGPLVQDPATNDAESFGIIEWLDQKEESSTVLVSFGSEYYLSKQETEEIAQGLELSKVNFLWVVRFPHHGEERIGSTTIEEALPHGFLERLRGGNRGLVVEGWAPQAKILAHPSIGGFVSHCGWNSTLESIKLGVPILAVPMFYDQPFNARLLEEVGVGLEVKRGKEDGMIHRNELAEMIRRVVLEEDGKAIRIKARGFREVLRLKDEEHVNEFVEELVQLCKDNKPNIL